MRRILAGAILALCQCTPDVWDPMKHQPKGLPYAPSAAFADGRVMQAPPPGTVAQEAARGGPELREGAVDGELIRHAPMPPSAGQLARGQEVFDITCAACHGRRGDGQSPVALKMSLRPPPSMLVPPARGLVDGQLFEVVSQGYGMMPAFDDWLDTSDRWAVVAYVRALQLSVSVPASELDDDDRRHLDGRP